MKKVDYIEGYGHKISAEALKEDALYLAENKDSGGTTYCYLDKDRNGMDIAIVIGWGSGFEPESESDSNPDPFLDGDYRLCCKVAYQPSNSMMQCDYDVDWLIPYDKEDGGCIDSEVALYEDSDFEEVLAELDESWEYIDKNWDKLGHE